MRDQRAYADLEDQILDDELCVRSGAFFYW
jgi:hypothetical protein